MFSKFKNACVGTLIFFCSTLSSTAGAAIVWDWDSVNMTLNGASNVVVAGYGTFDIEIFEGSCVDVFSGCDEVSDFDFNDPDSAVAVATAILNTVFVDISAGTGAPANFDSQSSLIKGCGLSCFFGLPYGLNYSALAVISADDSELNDSTSSSIPAPVNGFGGPWVRVTPSVTAVPLPPAFFLMLSGLGFIGWLSRRR